MQVLKQAQPVNPIAVRMQVLTAGHVKDISVGTEAAVMTAGLGLSSTNLSTSTNIGDAAGAAAGTVRHISRSGYAKRSTRDAAGAPPAASSQRKGNKALATKGGGIQDH